MKTVVRVLCFVAVVALSLLLLVTDPLWKSPSPTANQGVLNLSEWDFESAGILDLDGEWECYEGQLLTPLDFADPTENTPLLSGYVDITADQLDRASISSFPQNAEGARTYRLVIHTKDAEQALGLRIGNIDMSNKLYIDGTLVGQSGTPSFSAADYTPRKETYSAYFESSHEPTEIILQTANFDYPFHSFQPILALGTETDIDARNTAVFSIELSGALLVFTLGLSCLILFTYTSNRSKRRELLYSFVELFTFGIIFIFSGEKIITFLAPNLSFLTIFRTIQVTSVVFFASLVLHTNMLNKAVVSDLARNIILPIQILYALSTLVMPYELSSYTNVGYFAFIICLLAFMVSRLCAQFIRAEKQTIRRKQLFYFTLCLCGIFFSTLNGFLYAYGWVESRITGSVGICLYIIVSQIILATRFVGERNHTLELDHIKEALCAHASYELKAPLESNALGKVDIKTCTGLAIHGLVGDYDSRAIRLVTDIPDSSIAHADEARVRQILRCLIFNAIRNTDEGVITIKAQSSKNRMDIAITDNGQGMTRHEIDCLFEPCDSTRFWETGVGLSFSRQLARTMGGDVYLAWSKEGKGSSFVLSLRKAPEQEQKLIQEGARRQVPFGDPSDNIRGDGPSLWAGSTVLVVDDEKESLSIACTQLKRGGFRVLKASSGIEALRIIEERKIDLVILDIIMPKRSGIWTCREIRRGFPPLRLPILMSTVGHIDYDMDLAFEAGANDFISKPFVERELLARARSLIMIKRSIEDTETNEMAFLQAQIKPHFLYNAINTIVSYCHTDNQRAAQLLTDFSRYLRLSFDFDPKSATVTIAKELEMVAVYMEIEKARFGEKISIEYDVDSSLNNELIPAFCIQPLVENAVKHGLLQKREGGSIRLSIAKRNESIHIAVTDDGVGIDAPTLRKIESMDAQRQGVGLRNIQKRIRQLQGAQIDIASAENKGTSVKISVLCEHS